jgi:hypothetical protein
MAFGPRNSPSLTGETPQDDRRFWVAESRGTWSQKRVSAPDTSQDWAMHFPEELSLGLADWASVGLTVSTGADLSYRADQGSRCATTSLAAILNSPDRPRLNMGPVPSPRSQLAIAVPRAGTGSGFNRAWTISCISGSHSAMDSRLSGARGLRIAGGRRPCVKRFSQLWANARRLTGATST